MPPRYRHRDLVDVDDGRVAVGVDSHSSHSHEPRRAERDDPCGRVPCSYVDVLSDVITVLRTGRPVSVRLAWRGRWGQRFASVPGAAGVQVILRGQCWLLPDDAGPVPPASGGVPVTPGPVLLTPGRVPPAPGPVLLAPGDVLFAPHGRGYALAADPGAPVQPCDPGLPLPSTVDSPDGVVLCGAYELDPRQTHPLLRSLPELIHLPAELTRSPELRATGRAARRRAGAAAAARRGGAGAGAARPAPAVHHAHPDRRGHRAGVGGGAARPGRRRGPAGDARRPG
ncbi:cupin domain-containing protein, partial [Dactylosporangium sp. NPDC005572]|uniref:cupin domain-containing protein n=1 Tax=Dactylosporangium sp. NPDC005572 TaxID=3156889 RepID=UPI0033ACA36A